MDSARIDAVHDPEGVLKNCEVFLRAGSHSGGCMELRLWRQRPHASQGTCAPPASQLAFTKRWRMRSIAATLLFKARAASLSFQPLSAFTRIRA